MRRSGAKDPVTPELRAYVLLRDQGCVIAKLVESGRLPYREIGSCRAPDGRDLGILPYVVPYLRDRYLTIAHVRDARGGRMGRRPPSIPRRLAAVCYGHHLADPVVDRADVRPAVDAYLERLEGSDVPGAGRPWERIPRVRGNVDSPPSDQGGER